MSEIHVTDRDDEFDRTSLRAGGHGYRVHRDYAAHFFRWGWTTLWFYRQEYSVLDVGCGKDVPLARVGGYRNRQPKKLTCVDLNKIDRKGLPKWCEVYDERDFTDIEVQRELWMANEAPYDVVVCFEVIEHMTVERGRDLLAGLHRLVSDEGYVMLSTPVFNGQAATNHIHEYTVPELQAAIQDAGFRIEQRYGTFSSYQQVKKGMKEWHEKHGHDDAAFFELYEQLREFHSDDVLACFVAPVLPDHARNNVWKLRKA